MTVGHPGQDRPASRDIPCLDGLRTVADGFVLCHHDSYSLPFRWAAPRLYEDVLGNGHIGVSLFFVLSGYLITRLMLREWDATGRVELGAFYRRRARRIIPAYVAFLLVVGGGAVAGLLDVDGWAIAASGTYTWNYRHLFWPPVAGQALWYLGHTWSLCIEAQFYLLWPLAFRLAGPRPAAWLSLAAVAASPVVRVAHYHFFPADPGRIGVMLHTWADPLLTGCLLALGRRLTPAAVAAVCRPVAAFWACTLLAVIVSPLLSQRLRGAYMLPVGLTAENVCLAVILGHLLERPTGRVGLVLDSAPLRYLGTRSYSIYLWQVLFIGPFDWQQAWLPFPLNFTLILLVAEASYRLIERPFMASRSRPATPDRSGP